jgi:uncharacterized pyridoxal phosphate-containing UPF0001 family protein
MTDQTISANIAKLLERVRLTAQKSQRRECDIRVLAVSKTRPAAAVRLANDSGLSEFGENYLQEALEKIEQLQDLNLIWHFIGPIQANKTRQIAEHFDWVHSVDRSKIARRLNDQRPAHMPPLQCCIQVNILPAASDDIEQQRAAFAALRRAQQDLHAVAPGLDTLSMGMSGDMEAAISEGSTLVRIGTDIFGPRNK